MLSVNVLVLADSRFSPEAIDLLHNVHGLMRKKISMQARAVSNTARINAKCTCQSRPWVESL